MEETPLSRHIRDSKPDAHSTEDQVKVAYAMDDEDVVPGDSELTLNELEELFEKIGLDLEYNLRTSLGHLHDIDVVEKIRKGPNTYIIHERRNAIVNGEDLDVLADTEIDRLAREIRVDDPSEGGETAVADGGERPPLREIVAEAREIKSEMVIEDMRAGDVFERISKLNESIDAIDEYDEAAKSKSCGRIIFRKPATRYRLSKMAVNLRRSAS